MAGARTAGLFRPRAHCDGHALGRRRFLLEGAGVGAEGQDVSKPDAPVDYIGEAGQLHDLRDDASPGL